MNVHDQMASQVNSTKHKKRRERSQINKIRHEKRQITTDTAEIQKTVRIL